MSRRQEDYEKVTIQDCEGIAFSKTKAALLVGNEKWDDDKWIPCSLIDDDSECYKPGTSGTLILPQWLVKKEGLE